MKCWGRHLVSSVRLYVSRYPWERLVDLSSDRACAEGALQMLQGTVLGRQPIRISISWERSPANKHFQPAGWVQIEQQWKGAYYGYGYVNMRNYNPPNKSAVYRVSSNPTTRFKSMEWCILWYKNVGHGYTTEPKIIWYMYITWGSWV